MEPTIDADYVRRLTEGEREVEEHFVACFGRLLSIKLRRRLGRSDDVEDIRQETFTRVLTALRKGLGLRDATRLGGFVNAVCDNVLRERGRRWSRDPETRESLEDAADPRSGVVAELVRDELVQTVHRVLDSLAAKDQAILRALFIDERERDELCADYGIERGYLRVLLHRAKEHFREGYDADTHRRSGRAARPSGPGAGHRTTRRGRP